MKKRGLVDTLKKWEKEEEGGRAARGKAITELKQQGEDSVLPNDTKIRGAEVLPFA